ncbi:MAG: ExbD/TolR family protein [Pontibacterium sp.]
MFLNAPRRKVQLSLTPLIDVVFILLLFFMLTSNFIKWGALDMNAGAAKGKSASAAEVAVLWLKNNDGEWQCGERRYNSLSQQNLSQCIGDAVVVRVDAAPLVSTQQLVVVMEKLAAFEGVASSLGGVR